MSRTPRCKARRKGELCFLSSCDHGKNIRPKKGRRAKSGQWWHRGLPPMTFMELADYSFRQSEEKAARMRPPDPMPDWRELVVIDEHAGPIDPALLDVLSRLNPKVTSGMVIEAIIEEPTNGE